MDGMARRAARQDRGDVDREVGAPKTSAAGVPAVARAMTMAVEQMGVVRCCG